ncbi:DUF4167 domain-containing protein [Bosea sp. TAF32]|uniref:DUF4167 domain-containing protein n=1 Tax=Bosea sp. TAF32 TaxID=3237482 RepID=UPI003F8DBB76
MHLTSQRPRSRNGRNQSDAQSACDLQARYERTIALARGAEALGDTINAERLYQQADHYRRLLNQKPQTIGAVQ